MVCFDKIVLVYHVMVSDISFRKAEWQFRLICCGFTSNKVTFGVTLYTVTDALFLPSATNSILIAYHAPTLKCPKKFSNAQQACFSLMIKFTGKLGSSMIIGMRKCTSYALYFKYSPHCRVVGSAALQ
jgi:hypothetical protein